MTSVLNVSFHALCENLTISELRVETRRPGGRPLQPPGERWWPGQSGVVEEARSGVLSWMWQLS